jgi:glycosyltransferase involved in cell wall biosynthesis
VDVQEAYFPQFFTFRDRWFRNYHHPASTQLANRVITISEFSRQAIARAHRIPPSKIDVVHLAPDETAHDSALVEGMSLPSGLPDRFLFYPANVWPHKNHDRLLAALTVARQRYGVVLPCVLTGAEVPNGSSLKNLIASHQLADQVLFLGYQPAAVVAALYRRATALVFPSLFEGFGLPVVEAMAAGCPVVCSSTTSLPEVAAGAAVYVNPEDPEDIARQLVTVWRDHQLRRDLSEKGKRRAQRFSVDAMADAHRRAFSAARDDFAQRGPQHYPRYLDCRDLAVSAWRSWYIRSGDAPWPWR